MERLLRSDLEQQEKQQKGRRKTSLFEVYWKPMWWLIVPSALTVYYLTIVMPEITPVPEGLKVPWPAVTELLETVVAPWVEANSHWVFVMGIGILIPGLFFKFESSAEKYYFRTGLITFLLLACMYLSVSAPIDRLIKYVEDRIPADGRTSLYLK